MEDNNRASTCWFTNWGAIGRGRLGPHKELTVAQLAEYWIGVVGSHLCENSAPFATFSTDCIVT